MAVEKIIRELTIVLREAGVAGLPNNWFTREIPPLTHPELISGGNSTVASPHERVVELSLSGAPTDEALAELLELERTARNCVKCQLCEGRKNVVFDTGNRNSPLIAFVGEGPGADEDEQGVPFVGRAGQLLTNAITNGMGLRREDVYICNVVKCRPPDNRAPLPDEMKACSEYLCRQLELVNPKVIVTLGQTPQRALSGVEIGITKLRGQWQEWRGFKLMPTLHPAYLLRNPPAKKDFWQDLQTVMVHLGISRPAKS